MVERDRSRFPDPSRGVGSHDRDSGVVGDECSSAEQFVGDSADQPSATRTTRKPRRSCLRRPGRVPTPPVLMACSPDSPLGTALPEERRARKCSTHSRTADATPASRRRAEGSSASGGSHAPSAPTLPEEGDVFAYALLQGAGRGDCLTVACSGACRPGEACVNSGQDGPRRHWERGCRRAVGGGRRKRARAPSTDQTVASRSLRRTYRSANRPAVRLHDVEIAECSGPRGA